MLYLAAMGLGARVAGQARPVDGVHYLDFLAPGLLASTAMQIGGNDAMYPIMGAIKWNRTYFAMLATPLGAIDVLIGHLAWIALRLFMVTSIYLAIMAAFGTVHSPLAILAIPVGHPHRPGLRRAHRRVRGGAAERHGLLGPLPLRAHPPVPLLGHLLPHRPAPGLAPSRRRGHTAVPRGGPVPGPHARPRGLAPAGAHLAYLVILTAVGFVVAQRTYRRRLVT